MCIPDGNVGEVSRAGSQLFANIEIQQNLTLKEWNEWNMQWLNNFIIQGNLSITTTIITIIFITDK